jgi:hypothetical protein
MEAAQASSIISGCRFGSGPLALSGPPGYYSNTVLGDRVGLVNGDRGGERRCGLANLRLLKGTNVKSQLAGVVAIVVAGSLSKALAQPVRPPQAPPPIPNADAYYRLGPDSLPQDGVPKGELRGPFTLPSQAYPGTQHTYWVYVPAQYNSATSADLLVVNDGQAYIHPEGDARAQNVLDNLIYRREIPVVIGVFINPGRRPDQPEPNRAEWGERTTNRPTEYGP